MLVVSDESWDFTIRCSYLVFADIKPEYQDITITCLAPAGPSTWRVSDIEYLYIEPGYQRKLKKIAASGYSDPNTMGIVACRAAYAYGEEWLTGLKEYLLGNLDYLREYLRQKLPQIWLVEPEGTYLAWLDFSALGLDDKALDEFITNQAGLWLNLNNLAQAEVVPAHQYQPRLFWRKP